MRGNFLPGLALGLVAAALGLVSGAPGAQAQSPSSVTVLTWNIKNTQPAEGPRWERRFPAVKRVLADVAPDLVGLTETDPTNLASVNASYVGLLGGQYERFPIPGTYPTQPANVVLWRTSRFLFVSGGRHVYSTSCQGQARNVVWAVLADLQSARTYFVAMTHLSSNPDGHSCRSARAVEVRELLAVVDSRPAGSVPIVMGDLNNKTPRCAPSKADGAPIAELARRTARHNLDLTVPKRAECSTANATFDSHWNGSRADDRSRLDYIAADHTLRVRLTGIDKHRRVTYHGTKLTPSDHYPVWAVLS